MGHLIDFAVKREYERLQKLGDRLNDIIGFIPLLKGWPSVSHRRILGDKAPEDLYNKKDKKKEGLIVILLIFLFLIK